MKGLYLIKAVALIIVCAGIAGILTVLITVIGSDDGSSAPSVPTLPGNRVGWVDTNDGYEVLCISMHSQGISCDWSNKRAR